MLLTKILAASAQNEGFFELVGQAISDFFSLDLGNYENLGVSASQLSGMRSAIIAIYIGLIFASFASVFRRRTHGDFIRALIEADCLSPEKAKTLSELGFERNSAVKAAIKSSSAYRGMLFCVEKQEYDQKVTLKKRKYYLAAAESGEVCKPYTPHKYTYDFSSAHFYVPEEHRYNAEFRFDKKGSGLLSAILVSIASILLMWATLKLAPDILQFFDNFVGMI